MTNRLTGEQLAQIRERAEKASEGSIIRDLDILAKYLELVNEDIPKLLAEIDELKAELSRLCPIGDLDVISSLKLDVKYGQEIIAEKDAEIERLEDVLYDAYQEIKRGKNGRALDAINEWGASNGGN